MLALLGCNLKQDTTTAERALSELHSRLTDHQDDQIFIEATPEYQKAMSAESSREFFKRIRSKLGTPHASTPIRIQANHTPAGIFLVCQFHTSFDNGSAQENVTWHLQDGKARLVVYQVVSPLLAE
jgi:hypothetical protein